MRAVVKVETFGSGCEAARFAPLSTRLTVCKTVVEQAGLVRAGQSGTAFWMFDCNAGTWLDSQINLRFTAAFAKASAVSLSLE